MEHELVDEASSSDVEKFKDMKEKLSPVPKRLRFDEVSIETEGGATTSISIMYLIFEKTRPFLPHATFVNVNFLFNDKLSEVNRENSS